MMTSFEVGAVFRIVNEASPQLTKILRQVRELNAAIKDAKLNMAALGKDLVPLGMTRAVGETQALAAAWRDVAVQSGAARRALGSAGAAATRAAVPPSIGGGGRGGGGGRHQPGFMNRIGGGMHIGGPGAGLPGGAHVSFRGGAAAAAGLLGYGAYQAAEMEDAVWQLIYHSGVESNDANRAKFRKILQDAMINSGYGLHDISESAKQEIRMFQGTPGGGIDVLPEMLRAATIESRLKGESPEESMRALIGLAHMTKQYSPDAIKKLAPAFAFLSTANPGSLSSIERAAGYAVPLLQSGLEIDPMQSLLLGTALTRAGATNTKSGTWLREMALRAMPGTSLMSRVAFAKHEEALKALGLVDDQHRPTWFTDGRPDVLKMLDIGGQHAAAIPLEKRAAYERQLFGAQGGGGFALLADPAVREQVMALGKEMNSPAFKNRYGSFMQNYNSEVTAQAARTAMQEFNVTMMDIGAHTLPAVNATLKDFRGLLDGVRGALPGAGAAGWSGAKVGARTAEGALVGAAVGAWAGGIGAIPGALVGGAAGGAFGLAEQYMAAHQADRAKQEQEARERSKAQIDLFGGLSRAAGTLYGPKAAPAPPIHLNLNIDGRTLAAAVSEQMNAQSTYTTDTPASNGSSYDGP